MSALVALVLYIPKGFTHARAETADRVSTKMRIVGLEIKSERNKKNTGSVPKPYKSQHIKFLNVAKQILKRKPVKRYIASKHATINLTLPLGVHLQPNKLTLQTQDAK